MNLLTDYDGSIPLFDGTVYLDAIVPNLEIGTLSGDECKERLDELIATRDWLSDIRPRIMFGFGLHTDKTPRGVLSLLFDSKVSNSRWEKYFRIVADYFTIDDRDFKISFKGTDDSFLEWAKQCVLSLMNHVIDVFSQELSSFRTIDASEIKLVFNFSDPDVDQEGIEDQDEINEALVVSHETGTLYSILNGLPIAGKIKSTRQHPWVTAPTLQFDKSRFHEDWLVDEAQLEIRTSLERIVFLPRFKVQIARLARYLEQGGYILCSANDFLSHVSFSGETILLVDQELQWKSISESSLQSANQVTKIGQPIHWKVRTTWLAGLLGFLQEPKIDIDGNIVFLTTCELQDVVLHFLDRNRKSLDAHAISSTKHNIKKRWDMGSKGGCSNYFIPNCSLFTEFLEPEFPLEAQFKEFSDSR